MWPYRPFTTLTSQFDSPNDAYSMFRYLLYSYSSVNLKALQMSKAIEELSGRNFCRSVKEFCLSPCSQTLRAVCLLLLNRSLLTPEGTFFCSLHSSMENATPLIALYKAKHNSETAWKRHRKMHTKGEKLQILSRQHELRWGHACLSCKYFNFSNYSEFYDSSSLILRGK